MGRSTLDGDAFDLFSDLAADNLLIAQNFCFSLLSKFFLPFFTDIKRVFFLG